MNTIGYIVTKRNIKGIADGFKIVGSFDEVKDGKPYLVIGLSEAKKISNNFSILNHKLDDNGGFWTFGKTEKRNDYERALNDFYRYCLFNIVHHIKYNYINILKLKYSKLKKLLNIFNNREYKYIYINKDMIYLYFNGNILGISLAIIDYCGISKEKIIKKLRENPFNIIKYDDLFLSISIKYQLKGKKYIIPYFMSIQEE